MKLIQFGNASGIEIVKEDDKTKFYKYVCEKYTDKEMFHDRFPGPQPKSIERSNFEYLKQNDFFVCEKTDGVRYLLTCMMWDHKPYCFLVNRNKRIILLNLRLDVKNFDGTIVDGELVHTDDDTWYFMLFDVIYMNGTACHKLEFNQRVDKAKMLCDTYTKRSTDPFTLRTKTFIRFNGPNLKEYVTNDVPLLKYKTDGYIFTPLKDEIQSGTHENMFKWKPKLSNTIDFKIRYTNLQNKYELLIGNRPVYNNELEDCTNDILQTVRLNKEGCVVECEYVNTIGKYCIWRPLLIRHDKQYPNSYRTFSKTILNIKEDIQLEEFFNL
jgi:hypothetical protein